MKTRQLCLVVLAITLTGGACTMADDNTAGDLALGLTGQSSDGARYRLAPARFDISNQDNYYHALELHGDDSLSALELPAGVYAGELQQQENREEFVLERLADDGSVVETVTARLMSSNPVDFAIAAGQTTGLTLTFALPNLETVRFDNGNLAIDIEVGDPIDVPAAGARVAVALDARTVDIGATASPQFQDWAAELNSGGLTASHTLGFVGDWYVRNYADVCIAVTVDRVWLGGSSGQAWQQLMQELTTPTGRFCISRPADRAGELMTMVSLQVTRVGAAQTSPLVGILGTHEYEFDLFTAVYVQETGIWDGSTLNLQLLAESTEGAHPYLNYRIRDPLDGWSELLNLYGTPVNSYVSVSAAP